MNTPSIRTATYAVIVASFGLLLPAGAEANQKQYRALLAKFFLLNHLAIPLHNNGNVKSGDVLKLPEEASYTSRDVCYDLGPVKYTTLNSEFIKSTFEVAGEVGGSVTLQKIAEIEAELGAKLGSESSILLDPFSQEGPPKGMVSLMNPKQTKECAMIPDILNGSGRRDHILVTRVFHGKQSAQVSVGISANANVSAKIKEAKIKAILGGSPEVRVKPSGSTTILQIARTPDALSLAIQSAVIKPQELARIYLQTQSNSSYDLEVLVQEYVTGSEPAVLDKIFLRLQIALKELSIFFGSTARLYSAVFSGEGAVPIEKVQVPPEHWRTLAAVAAAHEIVGTQLPLIPQPPR